MSSSSIEKLDGYNSEGHNDDLNKLLKKIARDNKERQIRQRERQANMLSKLEQTSLD